MTSEDPQLAGGTIPVWMHCDNQNCLREVQPGWMSCPHCGFSLAGDAPRPDESSCDHEFVIEGPFCIICGFSPEFGYQTERIGKRLVATLLVVVLTLVSLYLASLLVNPTAISEENVFRGRLAGRVGFLLAAALLGLSFAVGWLVRLLTRRPS
ncbi:MAG: hypothetical protein HONBIEJF_00993 [Fimbriimonadaceae bacterium]|nr:hypothetical protein [Fimbriimonadaceae bacterium]